MTVTTAMTAHRLTDPDEPLFADATELFDEYRQHYGANPAPEAVAEWVLEQVLSSRTRIYVAGTPAEAYGICSIAILPAALTLRTVWLVRDLFVAPPARGMGVARALLMQVAGEARTAGAHRLSLQTEIHNTRAIELYAQNGYTVLTDVALMDHML
ncbi:GNAT superfamily N-acetyltransferase [Actinoplanes tereljensis]|uniref:N-acetyltransferase n=1 Tax=Paractinoplanes tereljensis TaxID=571912 RepID=A0A919NYY3_9ACTN|nr:GNAT family N-acetyltransferase [Actinoplanes tereljensis]GIF26222.1 N-acetyltransferase [Actinoplanes tereljensis]